MNRVNQLRQAYQRYMSARTARYDEIVREKGVDKEQPVQALDIHKKIWIQINNEERQSIDNSGSHNIGVPTRRK